MTITTPDSLRVEAENLDAINDPSVLLAKRNALKDARAELQQLINYCEAKQHAIESRQAGDIPMAQRFESVCETVYGKLPYWAKW